MNRMFAPHACSCSESSPWQYEYSALLRKPLPKNMRHCSLAHAYTPDVSQACVCLLCCIREASNGCGWQSGCFLHKPPQYPSPMPRRLSDRHTDMAHCTCVCLSERDKSLSASLPCGSGSGKGLREVRPVPPSPYFRRHPCGSARSPLKPCC